jgi:hypothetical protein
MVIIWFPSTVDEKAAISEKPKFTPCWDFVVALLSIWFNVHFNPVAYLKDHERNDRSDGSGPVKASHGNKERTVLGI